MGSGRPPEAALSQLVSIALQPIAFPLPEAGSAVPLDPGPHGLGVTTSFFAWGRTRNPLTSSITWAHELPVIS